MALDPEHLNLTLPTAPSFLSSSGLATLACNPLGAAGASATSFFALPLPLPLPLGALVLLEEAELEEEDETEEVDLTA